MRSSVAKRVGSWIIATLLLLLSGCSAVRITYSQGPLLAYWWLDGYADFSGEQAPLVRQALADWFAWHRQTQLPEYATWLASLQPLAREPVTAALACQVAEDLQRRLETAYAQAVPAMAEIVRGLTPAQIDHIEKRYARNLQEAARDYLQADPAQRAEAALKRTAERAEMIYGRLEEPQLKLLAAGLEQTPFDPQLWLAERRARQQDILRTLRKLVADKADSATVQSALRAIAANAVRSPRAEYRPYLQRLQEANCALAAQLHNSLKPAQRQRAVERLKGWEEDLRALVAEAP
jgi:uncharacterized protein DUF6279